MGKRVVSDETVTAALEQLRSKIVKSQSGDALASADTEGDLSSEGEDMSKLGKGKAGTVAKGKKPPMKKMYSESDKDPDESSGDEESSDEESSPASPPVKKGMPASEDASSDEESSDEESSPAPVQKGRKRVRKSLVDRAEDDADLRKGFAANDFLKSMTERLSDTVEDYRDELRKSHNDLIEQVDGLGENFAGMSATIADLTADNAQLKKGMVVLADGLTEALSLLGRIAKAPVSSGPRSVLRKGDVTEPSRLNDVGDDSLNPMQHSNLVKSYLQEKIEKGEVPSTAMAAWEQMQNVEYLPQHIVNKMLADFQAGWKPKA